MKLVGLALALVLLLSAVLSPSQATPDARADPNPFFFKKKKYGYGGYGHGGYGGYGHGGYGGYGHGGYGGYGIRKYW
ncbi:neuropeptide-like protein 28 [Penaeus monodon]|uniref:neuropeptide-like protein 28 n=1 Tax=Penaeus monodon TaxID=6687 RepID=UPI0018A6E7A9|nr:neuropeptide-like protein 28 [Penaeus monodon]